MAHLAMCQSSPNRNFARGEKTPPDADIFTNPPGANCHCDCDGYRPDILGGDYGSCSNRTGYTAVKLNSPDPFVFQAGKSARLERITLAVEDLGCWLAPLPHVLPRA